MFFWPVCSDVSWKSPSRTSSMLTSVPLKMIGSPFLYVTLVASAKETLIWLQLGLQTAPAPKVVVDAIAAVSADWLVYSSIVYGSITRTYKTSPLTKLLLIFVPVVR